MFMFRCQDVHICEFFSLGEWAGETEKVKEERIDSWTLEVRPSLFYTSSNLQEMPADPLSRLCFPASELVPSAWQGLCLSCLTLLHYGWKWSAFRTTWSTIPPGPTLLFWWQPRNKKRSWPWTWITRSLLPHQQDRSLSTPGTDNNRRA